MNSRSLALWLMDNAGPVIRYRTLVELLGEQDVFHVNNALEDLYESKLVQKWLSRLQPNVGPRHFHGSKPIAFENAIGKLVQLGIRAGLQVFDRRTLPFRTWLADNTGVTQEVFCEFLLASFLAYAGYDDTDPVRAVMQKRLQISHWFVENVDYDSFYVEDSRQDDMVNPMFFEGGALNLPMVHDIRGFASSKWIFKSAKHRRVVETVVEGILSPEYQALRESYGYMRSGKGIYSIGWDVRVQNYSEPVSEKEMSRLLLELELLAPFKAARQSDWFQQSMDLLEGQQTEEGYYRFPRTWIPEKPSGYWVTGAYNALEDNRRKQDAIDYESTFRILKIKQLAGLL